RYSRCTGAVVPVAASKVSDGDQRLPRLSSAIDDTGRKLWPRVASRLSQCLGTPNKPIAERVSFGLMDAAAVLLDRFACGPASHPQDNGPGHDGVGQVADTGQGGCSEHRELLHVVLWADAAGDRRAAPIAGV